MKRSKHRKRESERLRTARGQRKLLERATWLPWEVVPESVALTKTMIGYRVHVQREVQGGR